MTSRAMRTLVAGTAAFSLALALALAGTVLTPTSAEAQAHRFGAGFTTGGSWVSDLNPGATGVALSPGVGAYFGIHADRWYGADGRIGVRYQAAYQQPRFAWTPGDRKIDAASADVSALFRIVRPADAGAALPFVSLGAGGYWYNLGRGEPTFYGAAGAYHDGGSRILPALNFGAGVDLDFPWQFQRDLVRLRLEVADHLTFGSPLRQSSNQERYGAVHHLRFSIGLHSALDFKE
jgi:hypothetical protein